MNDTERQLSDELYVRFRDLLRNRYGLFYPERKRADLAHGLNLAIRSTGHSDFAQLYDDALNKPHVWDEILAHLTIGETYFFRNMAQFAVLRDHILPELMRQRSTTRNIRIWSAGCATGEEPYSIAMLLADLLPAQEQWHVSILATDINPQFLRRAREGLYGEWSFRETPPELRARFFTQEQQRWRLAAQIRRTVTFTNLNLAEPCYPSITNGTTALDVIFCRNVTIYFDEATTRAIAERFYDALAPGGWLIVGHAEPQASVYQQFEVHNFPSTVIYRKPLNAPLFGVEGRTPSREPAAVLPVVPVAAPQSASLPSRPSLPRNERPEAQVTSGRPGTQPLQPMAGVSPELLVAQARQRADKGEWVAAEELCAQALDRNPLSITAHYLLAQIHEHQGRLNDALAAYRRTVYLDPNFVLGTIGMAHIWRQLGRVNEARRSFRNALQYLSNLPPAAPIPGADDVTAAELVDLVTRLARSLDTSERAGS